MSNVIPLPTRNPVTFAASRDAAMAAASDPPAITSQFAYLEGYRAAQAMLRPGNLFEGGMNIADRLAPGGRYAEAGSPRWVRWQSAMLGAMEVITAHRDIITAPGGRIISVTRKPDAPAPLEP